MKQRSYEVGVSDLGVASALICAGYVLVDISPSDNGESSRVIFYFAQNESVEKTIGDYWAGRLSVDAKQYWQETKNLKTRLYSLRRS